MENREIAKVLKLTAKLMELHNANEFKVKSFQNAAFRIERLEVAIEGVPVDEIEKIEGINKGISQRLRELMSTGKLAELDEYLLETPAGVVRMMEIKGIGPKKAGVLWKDLGVESPEELLYACNENRLLSLKGFGEKTQDQIRKAIEFSISNQGLFHYAKLETLGINLQKLIQESGLVTSVALTGAFRRKCEIIDGIDLLIAVDNYESFKSWVKSTLLPDGIEMSASEKEISFRATDGYAVRIFVTGNKEFVSQLIKTTGSEEHLNQLKKYFPTADFLNESFNSEEEFYRQLKMDFIVPELREGLDEIDLALKHELPVLVDITDLKGCLHNHSTYSDGLNSLADMARQCIDLGYEYFGICDHSKSAFYANGLSIERVLEQHHEIDQLNVKFAPFKILKGIESDILHDGSLDYPDEVLASFDFIVASVHSGLKMTLEKATERILTAVSNPYTTILGHPTGRLLLAREGYPLDHKKIIDACADHDVIIELNAHPFRLDLDWRWIRYAVSKGVKISINPDAHHVSGIQDMYYGVCVARKGMLTKDNTFNAMSLKDVEAYLKNRKAKKNLPI